MKNKIIPIAGIMLAAFVGLYILFHLVSPGGTEDAEDTAVSATADTKTAKETDAPITFHTVSLDDQPVTADIFSDYDLTIVHVWGTYCGPCIAEMGDYAGLYRELPDNVNLVALVCDVYDGSDRNVAEAKEILADAGAEFLNLRMNSETDAIIEDLQYIPSSFFVDREGHLVGDMLEGKGIDETIRQLKKYTE